MYNIPCKYAVTERQSVPYGMGSATMEWADCAHPNLEDSEECSEKCLGYEPCEVKICEKHGEYLAHNGCDGCLYDDYEEMKELQKKHPEYFK